MATPWTYFPEPLRVSAPPITDSAGGTNLALNIARNQPRKKPKPWYHPTNLLRSSLIAGLMVFLYLLAR